MTATVLAALRNDRIEPPCVFDGPINGERFLADLEQVLAPNDIVVLDNLGSHQGKAVRRAIKAADAWPLFLAEDSPDLIPIAEVFANARNAIPPPAACAGAPSARSRTAA